MVWLVGMMKKENNMYTFSNLRELQKYIELQNGPNVEKKLNTASISLTVNDLVM